MKKFLGAGLTLLLVLVLITGMAWGDSIPASKAAYQVANISVLHLDPYTPPTTNDGYTAILNQQIKTSNGADLFVTAALECGLYTDTSVYSTSGSKSTSTATAAIKVRVKLDGTPIAYPPEVTYNRRMQQLTAQLSSALVGVVVPDLYIDLVLDTMEANSFSFCIPNVTSGIHTVTVEAKIDGTTPTGSKAGAYAEAYGTIGWGSVSIEEVKMIKQATDYPVFP